MSHVDSNLVGTTAFKLAAHMSMSRKALNQAIMGYRGLATFDNTHFLSFMGMTANGRIHRGTTCEGTNNYRLVLPTHAAGLQLINQRCVGNQASGNHHNP